MYARLVGFFSPIFLYKVEANTVSPGKHTPPNSGKIVFGVLLRRISIYML